MKKGYWVVCYRSVSNPEALKSYAPLALAAIAEGGGRPLVRTSEVEALESGLEERTVVMEFPSLEAAKLTYSGEAYQKALAVFCNGAVRDFRIVEGV